MALTVERYFARPVNPALTALLDDTRLWRGGAAVRPPEVVPAGSPELAGLLPGGGWPVGVLTEVLSLPYGSGEVGLVLPGLASLSQAGRTVAWIGAPYPPYAPALVAAGLDVNRILCVTARDTARLVWTAEQVLQSGACGAVLVWLDAAPMRQLRRLQLAARGSRATVVLFRPASVAGVPSPAMLRLFVEPLDAGIRVRLLKCRGARQTSVWLPAGCPAR